MAPAIAAVGLPAAVVTSCSAMAVAMVAATVAATVVATVVAMVVCSAVATVATAVAVVVTMLAVVVAAVVTKPRPTLPRKVTLFPKLRLRRLPRRPASSVPPWLSVRSASVARPYGWNPPRSLPIALLAAGESFHGGERIKVGLSQRESDFFHFLPAHRQRVPASPGEIDRRPALRGLAIVCPPPSSVGRCPAHRCPRGISQRSCEIAT